MPTALITGITGQDGSYLAELLLEKGYEVDGIIRRSSSFNTDRNDHIYQNPHEPDLRLRLHYGDLTDGSQLARLIRTVQPDQIYNLASQSHVAVSFQQHEYTGDVDGIGVVRLLEAIREAEVETRFYQACSSEMFGDAPPPQNEGTAFRPRSPYAAAKLYAYWLTRNYREGYGMFAVNGILFNHESERRDGTFVTRPVARIAAGVDDAVYLGNLDAVRDWVHAADYVRAMWLMMQQDGPADYVIGTGETHTVREVCQAAFGHVGLDRADWVRIDPVYYRPTEVEHLHADPARAKHLLGWEPEVTFEPMIHGMVEHDLRIQAGLDLDQARQKAETLGTGAAGD